MMLWSSFGYAQAGLCGVGSDAIEKVVGRNIMQMGYPIMDTRHPRPYRLPFWSKN